MSDIQNLKDFLEPVYLHKGFGKEEYKDGQFGKVMDLHEDSLPDFLDKDLILVGCGEQRGFNPGSKASHAPNAIREEFYKLQCWHPDLKIADAGNIKIGASLNDTHAALKTVIRELSVHGKMVVVLGGSCDLTLSQYQNYADQKKTIEAVCVDALINLNIESPHRSGNYLMEMLTGEPNYIRNYNHIGFQSYYVHPHMLETMDKLRFDCYRLSLIHI